MFRDKDVISLILLLNIKWAIGFMVFSYYEKINLETSLGKTETYAKMVPNYQILLVKGGYVNVTL